MAFRGYELNMVIRVQDRAASRLRRLATDLGGVNRAAELQRKAAQLSNQQTRTLSQRVTLSEKLVSLTSKEASLGFDREKHEIRINRLKGQQARLQELVNRGSLQSGLQEKRARELLAITQEIKLTENMRTASIAATNAEYAKTTGMLKAQAVELADINRLQALEASKQAILSRGRTFRHAGSVASMTGGVGLLVAGAAASQFASFNRETVRAGTQLRGVGEDFRSVTNISKVLGTEIYDLSRKFPASASEMAKSAYEIASGMDLVDKNGNRAITTQQRFDATSRLLKVANQAAVAGFVDLGSITDALIVTFNNFDPTVRNSQEILNTLFAIVQYGKGSFEDFTPVFGRMAASANAAGQTLKEAGGAVAFLSQRLNQTQAVTAYTRLLQIMSRKEFRAGFESFFGISATTTKGGITRLKQLSEIINIIVNRKSKLGDLTKGGTNLSNLIAEITARGQDVLTGKPGHVGLQATSQARIGIFNLVQGWQQYIDILAAVSSNTNAFSASLKAASESPGVKWQIAQNQFKAFAIIIGQQVLPVILNLINFFGRLAHQFENLPGSVRRLIGQFAAWSAILLLVGGTISILVGSIISLTSKFGGMATTLGAEGASGALGRSAKLLRIMKGLAAVGVIKILIDVKKSGGMSWGQIALLSIAAGLIAGPEAALLLGAGLAGSKLGANVHGGNRGAPLNLPSPTQSGRMGRAINQGTLNEANRRFNDLQKERQNYARLFGPQALGQMDKEVAHVRMLGNRASVVFQKINKDTIGAFQSGRLIESFKRGSVGFNILSAGANRVSNANKKAAASVLQQWRDLASQLTGLDIYKGLSEAAASSAVQVQVNLAAALASGDVPKIKSTLRETIKFDEAQIKRVKHLKVTAQTQAQLIQLYNQETDARAKLAAYDTKATKAADRANKALETAKNKVDALKLKIAGLHEENINKIAAAFGQIGQGPLSQGPIGQIFNSLSSTLSGFGGTFKIPIEFTLADQAVQQKNFDLFNKDLAILAKKGAPAKSIQDLLGQGVGALPLLEGVLHGPGSSPAKIKQFIDNLKKGQASIAAAGKTPWDKQINAANIQLVAAKKQLEAAKGKVAKDKAEVAKTKAKPKVKNPSPHTTSAHTPTRTPQMVGGHTYNITADGATPGAVLGAINQSDFLRRHRRT